MKGKRQLKCEIFHFTITTTKQALKNHTSSVYEGKKPYRCEFCDYCPKNLTFPKAEHDQRCPCLVVVIFCLFFFQFANQIYHLLL